MTAPVMPPLHYFDKDQAPTSDIQLGMAKMQGYVPQTCLLGGLVVMSEVMAGRDPCTGCEGPREKCHGRPAFRFPLLREGYRETRP